VSDCEELVGDYSQEMMEVAIWSKHPQSISQIVPEYYEGRIYLICSFVFICGPSGECE